MPEKSLSNLPKMMVIRALRWFMLIMPVIIPFFQSSGLNMGQIMILQAVFSIVVVILEIPSGYFADRIGRKNSILWASVFGFIGYLTYSFSYHFIGFLIGEILLAIGQSLISGADSALIYDSLLVNGKESNYTRWEGRYSAMGNFSEGVASIIGSLLAVISIRLPLYGEAFLFVISIFVAFTLKEPPQHHTTQLLNSFKDLMKIVRFSLLENLEIRWLILYSAFIGASTLVVAWFAQVYFKLSHVPLAWFGVIWALLQFAVGLFSWIAEHLEKRVGRKGALISFTVLLVLAFTVTAFFQHVAGLAVLLIFYFVRGFSSPIIKDYVNRLTESSMRATVLSVKNMMARVIFAVVGPLVGWLSDAYSFTAGFVFMAVFILISGFICLIKLSSHRAL